MQKKVEISINFDDGMTAAEFFKEAERAFHAIPPEYRATARLYIGGDYGTCYGSLNFERPATKGEEVQYRERIAYWDKQAHERDLVEYARLKAKFEGQK